MISAIVFWIWAGGVYQYCKDRGGDDPWFYTVVDAVAWPWDLGKWLVRAGRLAVK